MYDMHQTQFCICSKKYSYVARELFEEKYIHLIKHSLKDRSKDTANVAQVFKTSDYSENSFMEVD